MFISPVMSTNFYGATHPPKINQFKINGANGRNFDFKVTGELANKIEAIEYTDGISTKIFQNKKGFSEERLETIIKDIDKDLGNGDFLYRLIKVEKTGE